jgi:hypothetical protein
VYGKAVDDHGALTVEVGKIEVLGGKDREAFFDGLLLIGYLYLANSAGNFVSTETC